MNSVNYPGPGPTHEISKTARSSDGVPLSAFAHGSAQAAGATGKQRALVGALVAGVQLVLVLGLAYGLTQKDRAEAPPALTVSLLPEQEEEQIPPPPPLKPTLQTPQIVMNIPPPVQIYVPPPLAQVQSPPSPITATTTPPSPRTGADPVQVFQVKLLRHLSRHKRYPASARSKKEQGTVFVRFTMDRRGKVLAASVEKACAFETLNLEGVAMLNRAQPLPLPPPEMEGESIEMIVPVEFSLRSLR